MTSATISSPPTATSILPGADDPVLRSTSACGAVIAAAHAAWSRYLADPADSAKWSSLSNALRVAASAVATLNRTQPKAPEVGESLALIRELISAGVHARLAATVPQPAPIAKGWPGLLAMMLLHPSWHCAAAPTLDAAPEWLGGDYASWLFAVPPAFAAVGQADEFLQHTERHLESLARWTEMNPGSSVVKVALDRYHSGSHFARLQLSASNLRRASELHARILTRLVRKPGRDAALAAVPREGRRLRVGFVIPVFDESPATWASLALFTELDAERFETAVYVLKSTESRMEQHARQRAGDIQILPAEMADQVPLLSAAGLDVIVFSEEITGSTAPIARLAAHRLAPLQVVTSAHHAATTGLSTIDLFVAGDATGAANLVAHFSERVGMMRGPGRAYERLDPGQGADAAPTRAELGLPETGVLFVTAADWNQISPETQVVWAKLLQATPGSFLLVQRMAPESDDDGHAAAFATTFDRVLAAHQVSDDRLILSATTLPNHGELQRLIAACDVYLDAIPSSDEGFALAALQAGTPVVALSGATLRTRRVASFLSSLSLDELIAADFETYREIASRLANDSAARIALREAIRPRANSLPRVLDALATAEAFGDLLETAHDELLAAGPGRFRNNRQPLAVIADDRDAGAHVAAGIAALTENDFLGAATEARLALRSEPAHGEARALLGRALLAVGQSSKAVDYLLPSVEAADADASRWFDLARALQQTGQRAESIQALETSLRLDPKRAEGWLMLIDLAESSGAPDLARDALAELRENAPEHPDLAAIAARLGC